MTWNPNANDALGVEWQPSSEGSVVLDALTKCAAESIDQTGAATIGTIRVAVGAIPTRGGVYAVEVYDGETGVAAGNELLTARPNEDFAANGWTEDDGTATTIFSEIDEASPVNLADYIRSPVGAPAAAVAQYVHRYATGGLSLTGKRMLSVSVGVIVSSVPGSKVNNVLNVGMWIGGSFYVIGNVQARSSTIDVGYFTLLHNPATGAPWTIAEVQAFDTTSAVAFYVNNVPYSRVYVYQAWMDVGACTEARLAIGLLDDRTSALTPDAWNATGTMVTPTGGAWTKDGAGRHLYTVRRTYDRGSLVIPTLEQGDAIADPATGFSPVLDPTSGFITEMGDGHGKLFGLIQRTTAPAEHADSIAYADALEALVYAAHPAEQEITAVIGNYGVVRARVKPNAATDDLLIKIRKRSDSSQVGPTYTLTVADADALDTDRAGWLVLVAQLSSVAALTAQQYYVEFTSTAAGIAEDFWSVLALDTLDQGNATTFGGTTDRGTVNGSEANRYDLAVTIATVPSPVADFATSIIEQALGGDCADCSVELIQGVRSTWTPTALGAAFARYEIDRTEDAGLTWERVAKIVTEADTTFDDYESLRGVEACYRIRVIRNDESPSEWSAESCETPVAQNCEWLFTSNATPSLNAGYNQQGPQTRYGFPNADARTYLPIYGRDGRIALIGSDDLLAEFDIDFIVQAVEGPSVQGVAVFDGLRALMNADVPYVCVLDSVGNRFYADVVIPEGDADRETDLYVASLRVVELTRVPTPIT